MEFKSIWEDFLNMNSYPTLKENIKTDILIIGGGITGILCAYELTKKGKNVVLVEQNKIGMGVSKNTTAFISAQHEMLYQDIAKKFGLENAKKYLNYNLNAINDIKKLNEIYDIDYKECSSILFTNTNASTIIKEKEILDKMGYNSEFVYDSPIDNINIMIGLKFNNQGTINPLKLINALSKEIKIYENSKIVKLKSNIAYSENNTIEFNKVIIATNYPFINHCGLYFAKLRKRISYIVALNYKNINDTYCSIENGFYFRSYNDYLILGGNDRETKFECQEYFLNTVKKVFKNSDIKYYWTNEDVVTLDGLPYIGQYDLIHKNWYVATGFNMWGFSWSMASSKILTNMILYNKKEKFLSPNRCIINKQLFINIFNTLINMLKLKKPRCSHLKVALKYNKIDKTWECPSHGSRFDMKGNVINDPAKRKIKGT